MESVKKIASGVVWTMLLNVVNAVYGFISVPMLISYFGKSEYGLIGLAMSINVYLQLLDMGFTSTNVRFFSTWLTEKNHVKVKKAFQTSLGFYGIVGLINASVLFLLAVFSSAVFNVTSEQAVILKRLIYVLCFTAFFSWIMSCLEQLVKATENVAWIQKIHLLAKFFLVMVLFATVYIHLSIETYFVFSCLATLSVIPFCVTKIRKEIPFVNYLPRIDWPVFKEMLPYSLNIFSFSLFQFSFYNLRPVFLGIQGTVESVTDFRVLNGIVGIVTMMSGAFLGVLLPSTSRLIAEHNKEAFYKVAYTGTRYVSIIVCFLCFLLMTVGPELITMYVGNDYIYLIPWLNLWLICTLGSHNQAISSLILAGNDIRAISYSSMIASVLGLVSAWLLIPYYGVGGTTIAFAVYMSVQMLFYYLYWWPQHMKINSWVIFSTCFAPYVIIGAIISIVLINIVFCTDTFAELLLKGITFCIVYLILVLVFLKKEDLYYLRLFINK